jgi:hypothetical protein
MTQEETQETRESPALEPDADEVRFSTATAAPAEPGGDSPAVAQVLGAFVGAFVLAKVLKRLFGRD